MALRTRGKARPDLADRLSLGYREVRSAAARGRFAAVPARTRGAIQTYPEIDCIRHRLPPVTIQKIEQRAAWLGVGADRVLIAWGLMSEEAYLAALATSLHVPFEPMDKVARDDCPLADDQLLLALDSGLLPLTTQDGPAVVLVPAGLAARRLVTSLRPGSEMHRRTRITSRARLRALVTRHANGALGRQAADALRLRMPLFSAAPHRTPAAIWPLPAVAAVILASIFAPAATIAAMQIALTLLFLGWSALRVVGACTPHRSLPPPRRNDDTVPNYTVIVALHREARVLPELVAALKALDYPRERLQIILALEHDDFETQFAAEFLRLDSRFEIVIVPAAGPRTKPKALNAALAFARGAYTVIYDAEDRPEPNQLRRALEVLHGADDKLGCVQAALTIDNTDDGWLAAGIMAQTPQA